MPLWRPSPVFVEAWGGVAVADIIDIGGESVPEIAWLAVKVLPATAEMWHETRRQVKLLEKALDPIEVEVELEEERAAQRATELHREIERRLRPVTQEVRVELDQQNTAKSLAELEREKIQLEAERASRLKHSFGDLDKSLDALRRKHRAFFEGKAFDAHRLSTVGSDLFPWKKELPKFLAALEHKKARIQIFPADDWKSQVRGELDGFFKKEYRGRVEFDVMGSDGEKLADADKRIREEFGRHQNWKYVVDLDSEVKSGRMDAVLDGIRRRIREKAFGAHDKFEFEIKPEMDRGDLREIGRKLRHFKREWDKTELEFKLGLDHSARYITGARLAWLARDRWVSLKPIVDSKAFIAAKTALDALSGFRLARDLTTRLWDMVKNMDKAVPLIGLMASGLAVAASAASVLAMHTLTIGAGVVRAAEAVGLMAPGMAVAAGILAASFVVPLKNISDHITHIKNDFKNLSKEMGSSFWREAKGRFEEAYAGLFPRLRDGLKRTSQAAGEHFASVLVSLEKIVGPAMERQFEHTGRAMEELSKHSDGFAKVLRVLGDVGTSAFEDLLGWLGKATDKWADWLTEAERTGKLQEILDNGMREFQALGKVLYQTGRLFSGLTAVAREAGGATVDALAGGLKHAADIVRTQGFITGFKNVLEGARLAWGKFKTSVGGEWNAFWRNTSETFKAAAGDMGAAAGGLTAGLFRSLSSTSFQTGLRQFFSDLAVGVRSLDKVWPRLGDGLGSLLRVAGSFARGFGPVIASTLGALSNAVVKLEPVLSRVALSLGGRMASAIDRVAPLLTRMAEAALRLVEAFTKVPLAAELMVGGFLAFKGWKAVSGPVTALLGVVDKAGVRLGDFARWASLTGGNLSKMGGAAGIAGKGLSAVGTGLTGLAALATPITVALGAITAAFVLLERDSQKFGENVGKQTERIASTLSTAQEKVHIAAYNMSVDFRKIRDEAANLTTASTYQGGFWNLANLASLPTALKGKVNAVQASLEQYSKNGGSQAGIFGWIDKHGSHASAEVSHLADKTREFADSLNSLAEKDGPAAIRNMKALADSWRAAGVPANDIRAALGRMLQDSPALRSELELYAAQMSKSTDQASLLNIAMAGTASIARDNVDALEARNRTLGALNGLLDKSAGRWGLTFSQASQGIDVLGKTSDAFSNVGKASRDASGEAVKSVDDYLEKLREQQKAQADFANNLKTLMRAGFDTKAIETLQHTEFGANYAQQLADKYRQGGEAARDELRKANDTLAAEAQSGMDRLKAINAQGALEGSDVIRRNFEGLRGSLSNVLSQEGVDASEVLKATTSDQLQSALSDLGITMRDEGGKIMLQFRDGALYSIPDAVDPLTGNIVGQWQKEGNTRVDAFKGAGSESAFGFANGVSSGMDAVRNAAGIVTGQGVAGLQAVKPQWNNAGVASINSFIAGTDRSHDVFMAGQSAANSGVSGLNSVSTWSAGSSFASGFSDGIHGNKWKVTSAAENVANAALSIMKHALEVNSPSKATRRYGFSFSEGFAQGIEREGRLAVSAAESVAENSVAALEAKAANVRPFRTVNAEFKENLTVSAVIDPSSLNGAKINLTVDGESFPAYVSDVADSRVEAGFEAVYG